MNPPPPGPVSGLSQTHDVNAAATHASTAEPPALSTLAPASAVSGWPAAIAPFMAKSVRRTAANLKFRCTSTEEKARNVNATCTQIRARIGRRGIAAAVLLLAALVAAIATPQILGTRVAAAFDTLGSADPT